MKTDARVLEVDSTLEGEDVAMTLDADATAHIMSILTDLYSDPELAVIREYSTNAFDSHVEAGQSRPIEITLPTSLSPFFKVRDFGVGLDADGIRDTYSRYGTSTKRNSDDVVGMLGLGCKSALTYTDQFTLTGIKDGNCIQVAISRTEDGGGSMKIVGKPYKTDEPDGVEVVVPAKQHNRFEEKANHFFSFWNQGSVLVNSVEPKRVGGIWLADDLLMTDEIDRDVIVMGNVAYPASENSYGHLGDSRQSIVAFVNIGAINFTPSREALQMTTKTKNTIASIDARVKKERDAALTKTILDAQTPYGALLASFTAKRLGLTKFPQYKGKDLPIGGENHIPLPKGELAVFVDGQKYRGSKGWSTERNIYFNSSWGQRLWFTGFEGQAFSPHKRKQLEQWLEQEGIDTDRAYNERLTYVLVKEIPTDAKVWIDQSTIYNWADVAAQKIERNTVRARDGRPSGSYEGYVNGHSVRSILAADIDTSKPVFYTIPSLWEYDRRNPSGIIWNVYPSGATIVKLPLNRVNKFKRDFPLAEEVQAHCKKLANQWFKSLTKKERLMLHIQKDHDAEDLLRFDHEKINDPALKQAIRLAKDKNTNVQVKFKVFAGWFDSEIVKWENPLKKYHLLTEMSFYGKLHQDFMDHIYTYINAAYNAAEKES